MQAPTDPFDTLQRPYIAGFVFALVLTGIPFGLVVAGLLPRFTTLVVIAVLALEQRMAGQGGAGGDGLPGDAPGRDNLQRGGL